MAAILSKTEDITLSYVFGPYCVAKPAKLWRLKIVSVEYFHAHIKCDDVNTGTDAS